MPAGRGLLQPKGSRVRPLCPYSTASSRDRMQLQPLLQPTCRASRVRPLCPYATASSRDRTPAVTATVSPPTGKPATNSASWRRGKGGRGRAEAAAGAEAAAAVAGKAAAAGQVAGAAAGAEEGAAVAAVAEIGVEVAEAVAASLACCASTWPCRLTCCRPCQKPGWVWWSGGGAQSAVHVSVVVRGRGGQSAAHISMV